MLGHLLKYKQPFDWNVFAKEEEKMKRKKLARLQNLAASMNFQLTPLPFTPLVYQEAASSWLVWNGNGLLFSFAIPQ